MKVDFLHFGRTVLFFHCMKKENLIRIVISVANLLTHVIFTPIQQLSISLSVENRSPRRRIVKIFQAYFEEFSTCLIDCKGFIMISFPDLEKRGCVLSGVVKSVCFIWGHLFVLVNIARLFGLICIGPMAEWLTRQTCNPEVNRAAGSNRKTKEFYSFLHP